MSKIRDLYDQAYGDVPCGELERMDYLLAKVTPKRGLRIDITKEIQRILNIKWKRLNFTLFLVPKGTPRPRQGRGNHFYVKGAMDHKNFFKEFYSTWKDQPTIVTACKVTTISYLPIPSSMKHYEMILAEWGLIRPIVTPDFDNLIKTYCDMVQGTLLHNDSLIIEGTSKKYYSAKPRVEFTIEYMEEYDSVFNKNKMKGD